MKKTILLLLITAFNLSLFSQGIKFEENHNLNDALAKAKSENKLVFIDAYASWCGPCKMMAAKVFPLQEVGDYFNAHFICLKLDMEAPENLEIAKKYDVKAYPTYLFLDGNGEIQHRALGGMPPADFIKAAQTAADLENNFAGISKKIKAGDKNPLTIKKYLELNPYDQGNEALVDDYYSALNESQKTSKDAWDIFSEFVKNVDSKSFQYFLKNRSLFESKIGKKEVKDKLLSVFTNVYYNDKSRFENLKSIDPAIYEESKTLASINDAYRKYYGKACKENWQGLMKTVTPYLNKKAEDPQMLNNIAWMVFENYKKYNDQVSLKNALGWAKKASELAPEKDFILDTYANILYALGKKKEAVGVEMKGLEIAKKNPQDQQNIENFQKNIENFKK